MGNNQEMNLDTSFENEYQVQLENDLNSSFEKAFNNQFGKFEKEEDSITSYENLNQKCNKEAELDIKVNKEKESEQKNERKDFVESKGKSFIVINKDKKHKILEKYNKEKTENNSSSTQKTESSTQLNKDEEIENKKDSNENNKENTDLIILDKQIENINIEESEEIESKINNNNDTININTPNIPEENSEDTNLNKKRNRDKNINNKKINFDKILRRIKMSILDAIIRFINHKIEIDYNYDIGKGICEKKILQIDKKELTHSKVEENKDFLLKNLKDILATNISKKYTNYKKTHNIELIEKLMNKGEDYKKIFELTFLDCVEYIRGTKNISILDGLDKIDYIIKIEEQKMDKDEIENFVDFIMDYENTLDRKIGRNSKNQKMDN
jgi:hypothetical protein